ncbi:folliculin [Elysia marginata]|uniref:Folliculin n=1 Tax=Elysia marginata TaxID=1093978 RepID=A0AAV4FNH0_9GAST|nr:folliculin [Elysia marginata]
MNAIISLCHFCELHGPKILYCTQPFRPQEPRPPGNEEAEFDVTHKVKPSSVVVPNSSVKDRCDGCKSVQMGFVSHDEEAKVSYVSTQQPYNPEVFTRIRQACLRSLSSEVCPGREGPIFFGDTQCGHVLSYTFYIPDTQARGMHRWYSILVVMMDKIYLLNSWPFLVPHLQIVIQSLQKKAQVVYDAEEAKCPQRPLRMEARVNMFNFIKQRGGSKPARSLQEITGDKNVFQMLHVAFLWILKACGSRITEKLLEGPPTEDTIIDMEKQEETEEGFIKIYTRKLDGGELVQTDSDAAEDGEKTPSLETINHQRVEEECHDEFAPVVRDIRHLRKILGRANFQALAHHVVIGNQVIVSGHEKSMVKSFNNVLKTLLPKGCCRLIPWSLEYEESWRCNFLGLSPDALLPQHVNSSEMFVLVEIVLKPRQEVNENPSPCSAANCAEPVEASSMEREISSDFSSGVSGPASDLSGLSLGGDGHEEYPDLEQFEFNMSSPTTLPPKIPTVLAKMIMAVENNNLSLEVVEAAFTCLREEWMNKVKVLFKFTKAGGNRSEEDTKKLLQIVGARAEDKQLLMFWMTGLSVQYREHILAASAPGNVHK